MHVCLCVQILSSVGWKHAANENHLVTLLRSKIISQAAKVSTTTAGRTDETMGLRTPSVMGLMVCVHGRAMMCVARVLCCVCAFVDCVCCVLLVWR